MPVQNTAPRTTSTLNIPEKDDALPPYTNNNVKHADPFFTDFNEQQKKQFLNTLFNDCSRMINRQLNKMRAAIRKL